MNWYFRAWERYVDFYGRSQRAEFWFFTLCNAAVTIALDWICNFFFHSRLPYVLYSLAVLIPGLAVSIRRLHDTDRTGWWLLLSLVPIIGWIVLIVFYCQDSQPTDNRFGPNPKLAYGSPTYLA
jgi:uncharacterized membrane protein YhaH (DUF805 family)